MQKTTYISPLWTHERFAQDTCVIKCNMHQGHFVAIVNFIAFVN